jgi:hypothetical protein
LQESEDDNKLDGLVDRGIDWEAIAFNCYSEVEPGIEVDLRRLVW